MSVIGDVFYYLMTGRDRPQDRPLPLERDNGSAEGRGADYWFDDRSRIERAINGALSSAIAAHGPITEALRPSASKRVYGALKQSRRDWPDRSTEGRSSVEEQRDPNPKVAGSIPAAPVEVEATENSPRD